MPVATHVIAGTVTTGVTLVAAGSFGSPLTVTATGYVDATGSPAIGAAIAATVQNAGTVGAHATTGVALDAGGSITNTSTGLIEGTGKGVRLGAGGTVVNEAGGVISAPNGGPSNRTYGIYGHGAAAVDNFGTVHGYAGVYLASGSLTNEATGVINGQGYGFVVINGPIQLDNFGTISASAHDGVFLSLNDGTSTVVNEVGATIAGPDGLRMGGYAGFTLDNFGTILGTGIYGVQIQIYQGAQSFTNEAGGVIDGVHNGLYLAGTGPAVVENAGTITGENGYAVLLKADSSRLIVDGGAVFNGAVEAYGGPGTLELSAKTGAGTIGGFGTKYLGFQTIAIDSGATWSIGGTMAGFNGTTIQGFTSHDRLDLTDLGFAAGDSATLDNASDVLTIEDSNGTVLGTIQLSGDITGAFYMSDDGHGGSFLTEDTIAGTDTAGVTISNGVGGPGNPLTIAADGHLIVSGPPAIFATVAATVENFGTINASAYGVILSQGGSLTNASAGVIDGSTYGVIGIVSFQLDNFGTISGAHRAGVFSNVYAGQSATIVNEAGATISGGSNAGVFVVGAGTAVIENAGTIIGAGGTAVFLAAVTANRVIVDGGAVFEGIVRDNGTPGTLELSAKTGAGTISGFGSQYVGFQTLTIDSGATWTVGGTMAGFNGTTIQGFGSHDRLDLTDLTFNAGDTIDIDRNTDVLTIKNAARTVLDSLQMAGDLSGDFFYLASDGHGGSVVTDIEAAGVTISNGVGGPGNPLTIAAGSRLIAVGSSAIYATVAATVQNYGTVIARDANGAGVELDAGGSVTNAATGLIEGGNNGAVRITGAAGTVDNSGTIGATNGYYSHFGIYLGAGGTVVNETGGVIGGTDPSLSPGIAIYSRAPATGENFGTINASRYGVILSQGGSLTNASAGVIDGSTYGVIGIVSFQLDNFGTISGAHRAGVFSNVYAGQSATIVNEAGATISGGSNAGVFVVGAGTAVIENAGTIIGAGGTAVFLAAVTANRVIVDGGAVFEGIVRDNGTPGTLELSAKTGAGTISGFGSQYVGFQTLTIDSGATWTVGGTMAGFNGTTIQGFGSHDRLDLTDLTFNAGGTIDIDRVTDVLTIRNAGGTVLDTLQMAGDLSGDFFHLANDGHGGSFATEDTTPCFCRGTLIRTPDGDVAVETLRIGHAVLTAGGEPLPVKWIGRRSYRGWQAVGNPDVQPVCFKAGSIADHVPARDLHVSPEHAMFLDGVLVPARHLVNDVSILKVEGMETVEYFHLEFDRHAVILAEGAATESFVDDDSRMLFHNAAEYRRLYPDEPRRNAEFCAPRVEDGAALEAIRMSLAARAPHLRPGSATAPWVRRGRLELATRTLAAGWAFSGVGTGPMRLAVLVNGAVVAQVTADRHRPDLKAAGFGAGNYGFSFMLPRGLSPEVGHRIEVRREADWSLLDAGSATIEPLAKSRADLH